MSVDGFALLERIYHHVFGQRAASSIKPCKSEKEYEEWKAIFDTEYTVVRLIDAVKPQRTVKR